MHPLLHSLLVCLVVALSLRGAEAGGSILPYSWEVYNALLDYRIARAYAFDDAAIHDLGEIFMAHGANATFGLCLLHNHFHVLPGERMVEVVRTNASFTAPATVVDHENVHPSMMALTSEGDLRPMEFLNVALSDFGAFSGVTRAGRD